MILQLRRGSVREHNARPPAGKRLRRAHEPPYGKNQNARRNRGVPAMKCPVDNETLVMTERSGVEIDYCPRCRGVWLDRGELDKIIDRGSASAAAPRSEEHTSELQVTNAHLVCRLLLEKKKKTTHNSPN